MKPRRLGVVVRAVPRLYIAYPGLCLKTGENRGKTQLGQPKGSRLHRKDLLLQIYIGGYGRCRADVYERFRNILEECAAKIILT